MATFVQEDVDALVALTKLPHRKQAKHFMNAFWHSKMTFGEDPAECEKIWEYTAEFLNIDFTKRGNELDEFEAHKFLEKQVGAMTVKHMRAQLKEIDIDFNRMMSLTEFLLFHYKLKEWPFLVNWVPAGSPGQLKMLTDVQTKMELAQAALEASRVRAEQSKEEAEKAAVAVATDLATSLAEKETAEEQAAATAELLAVEKQKKDAIDAQEVMTQDASLSTVKRNRAIAQLAILKAEDSQPLRTARITQAAAERKARKAAKLSAAAAKDAVAASSAADNATVAAEVATEAADQAVATLINELEDAKMVCAGSGSEEGTLWWMDREFEESLKYMGPKQKDKALAARSSARTRTLKPSA